ncbi:MAG: hypothetical protein AAGD09_27140 [Cyanobacteria bacterium P01_F01_bin.56]
MNWRRMFYAGLVNTILGVGLGVVLYGLAATPYTSRHYQNLRRVYVVVGGAGGFVMGWSWEGLRQLKEKRDREEAELTQSAQSEE